MRILFFFLLISFISSRGQIEIKRTKLKYPDKSIKAPSDFGVIESLGQVKEKARPRFRRHKITTNNFIRNIYTNSNTQPLDKDPVLQFGHKRSLPLSPIKLWKGIDESSQGSTPPDPSGAVGLNHYVQMVNTAMQIFDKNGNSLWGPTSLSSVFPGSSNDGDPIVLFDQFAKRWFVSQFQESSYKMLIAISQTSDPLGGWFYYEYIFDEFPDYPKFSIWKDGYYMTANMTVQNAVCFERDKMLRGDPSARMVALTFPDIETNGFFSALPAHASGDLLPKDPINFFYFQDDGWAQGNDRIKVWEMIVDWNNPLSSSIFLKQELEVASFNTEFDKNWNDIAQPGTFKKLDAVPGAFMYMAHFRSFNSYNSITLCHTVDVDLSPSTIRSAIRWYDLHQENGSWKINQQSTYAPDTDNRWLGSIAIDRQGNIGMGYSVSSSTTFPSIRFTGRKKEHELSKMTFSESNAFNGEGVQNTINRFGDYSHMTIDPTDGLTFWYTGELIGNSGWETGIFSFKIGDHYDYDLSLINIVAPASGVLTGTEKVKILIKNTGKIPLSNFNLGYNSQGNQIIESFSEIIQPNDTAYFTFNSTIDLSSSGEHKLTTFLGYLDDQDRMNDTLIKVVEHPYEIDAGVTQITSPISKVGLNDEVVTVSVKNYGKKILYEIPLVLLVNGVTYLDTVKEKFEIDEIKLFDFTDKIDFSAIKTFEIIAFANLNNDQKNINDTAKKSIQNNNCNPTSYCEGGDKITLVKFGDINNFSDCYSGGYSDFTSLSTDLEKGIYYDFVIKSEETDHQLSVWIDYNDDKVFDSNEIIIEDGNYGINGVFTVVIPDDAKIGEHLMRVRTAWREKSSDPCSSIEYGETEDYMVFIVTPFFTEDVFNFQFEIFNEFNSIRVISSSILKQKINLEIFNGIGQTLYAKKFNKGGQLNNLIRVSDFARGLYYIKISNDEKSSVKQFLVR